MDCNGTLDLEEFVTFLRPIYPEKFSRDYLTNLFYLEVVRETKMVPNKDSTLTINQFCWILLENEGLSRIKIEKFLHIEDEKNEQHYVAELLADWDK